MRNREPWLFRIVPWFIGFTFFVILAYWAVIGIIAFFAVGEVSKLDFSNGIKPVIEKVWCGHEGCMDEEKK